MKLKKKNKILFWINGILWVLFSFSFLLMPFPAKLDEENGFFVTVIAGTVFWIGLIGGWTVWGINTVLYSREKNQKKYAAKRKHGVYQICADVVFVIALIILVVMNGTGRFEGFFAYIDLGLLTLSFHMHILFCGRIFRRMMNKGK